MVFPLLYSTPFSSEKCTCYCWRDRYWTKGTWWQHRCDSVLILCHYHFFIFGKDISPMIKTKNEGPYWAWEYRVYQNYPIVQVTGWTNLRFVSESDDKEGNGICHKEFGTMDYARAHFTCSWNFMVIVSTSSRRTQTSPGGIWAF